MRRALTAGALICGAGALGLWASLSDDSVEGATPLKPSAPQADPADLARRALDPAPHSSPSAELATVEYATTVALLGTQVVVSAPTYAASFDPSGFSFGSDGASTGVRYMFAGVTRGTRPIVVNEDEPPEVQGAHVRYARGSNLVEQYVLLDGGVEQLFSFGEIPPGAGDLVIRGEVETSLIGSQVPGGGVRFEAAGQPSITFGRAKAIDGSGQSLEVALALSGHAIEIRLPGDWLDRASGPLLVDPVITVDQRLTSGSEDEFWPDMAYNSLRDEFVLVYPKGTTLAASRIDRDGAVLQSGVAIDSSTVVKFQPVVTWSGSESDRYLILFHSEGAIYATVIDANLSVVSPTARLHDPPGTAEFQHNHSVAFDSKRQRWTVVWEDTSNSPTGDILVEQIALDGTQLGMNVFRNLSAALFQPSIAYSTTSDSYLVSYSAFETTLPTFNLQASAIDGLLSTFLGHSTISTAMNNQSHSRVAWNSLANEFLVVFQSDDLVQDNLLARRLSGSATLLGTQFSVASSINAFEQYPCVSFSSASNTYLVTYDSAPVSPETPFVGAILREHLELGGWDVWAQEVNANGTLAGTARLVSQPLSVTNQYFNTHELNVRTGEWFVAWEDGRSLTDLDVWGVGYRSESGLPRAVRFDPQDQATDVKLDDVFYIDFSHDMNGTSFNNSTVVVTQGGGIGNITTKTVTYLPTTRQVRVTVAGDWPSSQQLNFAVSSVVTDMAGVALGFNQSSTFTTGSTRSLPDTDGDGLLDAEETTTSATNADTDSDGLSDYQEIFVSFTDPTDGDTDNDGTLDGSDSTPNGSPENPTSVPEPAPSGAMTVTGILPQGSSASPAPVEASARLAIAFSNAVDESSISATNLTLQNQTTLALVTLVQQPRPSPETLVVLPSTPLVTGTTYKLTVSGGVGAIKDGAGQTVSTAASSYVTVDSLASTPFEAPHYGDTLASTGWELFPLTGPGAGFAQVIPSTRQLLVAETDVGVPGRGLGAELSRTYRSNITGGMFGKNWRCSYERGFTVVADQNSDSRPELQFTTSDGRAFTYLSGPTTQAEDYVAPPGFFDSLKSLTLGGTKHLVQRAAVGGTENFYVFHQPANTTVEDPDVLPVGARGFLVRIRDRNHNSVVLNRELATHALRPHAITSIVDDLDRETTLTYSTTAGQETLCTKVEQFTGLTTPRSWLYEYGTNGTLLRVLTPPSSWKLESGAVVTNTRREHSYTYVAYGAYHLLTSRTDGRSSTTLRVVYSGAGDVTQVDHGAGSDVGTAVYSFRVDSPAGVNEAVQVDRNGNVLKLTHEATTIPGTWLLRSSTVYTRGFHPLVPGGEPASYTQQFTHSSNAQLTECVSPSGRVVRWIRCVKCGCPEQSIAKSASASDLSANPLAGAEQDIVVVTEYDADFHGVIRSIEPRGNNASFVGTSSTIVASVENVASQTPRTFTNIDFVKRNAYTTFYYYDHENIANRLASDTTAIGDTVTLARDLPLTFGRASSGIYKDPPNAATFGDNDGDGHADRGGNLYAVRGPRPRALSPTTGAFLANRQVIEKAFTYNQHGQRILEIQVDGDRHRLEWYVGSFNLTTNLNRGYLKKVVVAASHRDVDMDLADGTPATGPSGSGLDLTSSLTYGPFGHVTTLVNPRGFTTAIEVDALGLPTKSTAPTPYSYEREQLFDGNGNVVEARVQNVVATDSNDDGLQGTGEQQEVAAHPDFVNTFVYNSANRLIRSNIDADGSTPNVLSTTYAWDPMQLLVSIREPEGNVHVIRHDERNLAFEEVRGASDSATSTLVHRDFDGDGNLLQVIDQDGNSTPQIKITYDAFSRAIALVDELGNRSEVTYDVAGLAAQTLSKGQARGDPGDLFTTYLSNTLNAFDEAGRLLQTTAELWNANELLAAQPGLVRMTPPVNFLTSRVAAGELVSKTYALDEEGLALAIRDDNDHVTTWTYDAADRTASVTDALGSAMSYAYDKNSNVIRVAEVEKSDDGLITETYYTEAFFDEIDRLVATVSHLGNTRRMLYDSRGNVLQVSDAMAAVGALTISSLPTSGEHGTFPQFAATTPAAVTNINGRGNTTRFAYDGAARALSTTRDLRSGGTGAGSVLEAIVTQQSWDGNNRVDRRVDPNGNATLSVFDHQNRNLGDYFADQTYTLTTYQRSGTVATKRDPRGVLETFTYDAAERAISATLTNLPPGKGQTTFRAWRWDGLDRRSRTEDDDSIVERWFDSLSREVEDKQRIGTGAPRTSSGVALAGEVQGSFKRVFDGRGNVLKQVYPGGVALRRPILRWQCDYAGDYAPAVSVLGHRQSAKQVTSGPCRATPIGSRATWCVLFAHS